MRGCGIIVIAAFGVTVDVICSNGLEVRFSCPDRSGSESRSQLSMHVLYFEGIWDPIQRRVGGATATKLGFMDPRPEMVI